MSGEEVEVRSRPIIEQLARLPEYAASQCVMLYWSCHNEVHTHDLVRQALKDGKKVVLPRCETENGEIRPYEVKDLSRDLSVGCFGILEPGQRARELTDLSEIDVCVVPGIAFDCNGNRIGRGLGYYDRFLRKLDAKTQKIGVGYAFQIVNRIYPTDNDTSIDKVVTEDKTLVASGR